MDRKDSPIFITGIPRSGASMVAGVLQIAGVFLGEVPKPVRLSARSMLENQPIHDQILEPYLNGIKADPYGQCPLPNTDNLSIPIDWRDRVLKLVEEQGYKDGPWVYKSNKLALTWPVWNFAFPNAQWIIVRRRSGDIIESCLTTSYMKAFKDPFPKLREAEAENEREAWLWMIHQYEQRFVSMITAGLNCRVIWPERMVNGDYSQLYSTLDWVGLKWTTPVLNKVLEYIDPKFWKVRR